MTTPDPKALRALAEAATQWRHVRGVLARDSEDVEAERERDELARAVCVAREEAATLRDERDEARAALARYQGPTFNGSRRGRWDERIGKAERRAEAAEAEVARLRRIEEAARRAHFGLMLDELEAEHNEPLMRGLLDAFGDENDTVCKLKGLRAAEDRVRELEGEVVAAKKVGRTEGEEAGREEALEAAAVLAETGGTRAGEMLARRIREYRRAALDAAKGET